MNVWREMQCKVSKYVWKLNKWLRIKNWEHAVTTHDGASGFSLSERNSIVYSPAARNSVNSVMEVRNKKSVIRKKNRCFPE